MCVECDGRTIQRRNFLKFGAAAAVAFGVDGAQRLARAAESGGATLSAADALTALKSGNERLVGEPDLCSLDLAKQRGTVAQQQAPWATIVSCADSRVPPELIFGGHGLGELFVARNAGNLVDTATLGTIEYGAVVLGSPVVVILAHSSCGAVKAACDVVTKNATFPGAIGAMIEPILPAALAVRDTAGDFVENTAKESARRTVARLSAASAIVAGLIDQRKLQLVAAIYDLQTGVVSYLA
jgi:carbonic anhydrase